jgi:hypothetical protein
MSVETSHPSHTPPQDTLPHAEYEHEGRLKIVITGLDKNRRDKSVEAAHAKLNEKIAGDGGGGLKSYLKHVFTLNMSEAGRDARAMGRSFRYGNVGRGYYLDKYRQETEQQIIESGNLLIADNVFDDDYRTQTTMRFVHEYDDLVHTAAGERRTKLDLETKPDGTRDEEGTRLKETLHKLIKDAADGAYDDTNGNFDEAAFNEDKKRAITDAVQQGLTKDHVGPSLIYADNLVQIATHVRAAVSQRRLAGESVTAEEILQNADIILGEAKTGARTEIKESVVEKVTNKLSKLPWVNEATVATAVSLAYSVGGWAVKRGIGRVVSAVALPGLAGGVWAALRENAHIKEDMVQHAREAAEGKIDRSQLSGLREKVDGAIYETKSATELKNQIGMLYDEHGDLRINSSEHFTEAMFMIAEAQARIRLSDERKIDLISFSDVSKVEKERFELDLALAKSKVDMRRLLNNSTDDELRALGLGDRVIAQMRVPENDALDYLMDPQIEGTQGVLAATISRLEEGSEENGEQGMNARDRVANKLRRAEVTKALLKGTLIGGIIGLVGQEIRADFSDNQEGILFEGQQPNTEHQTALRALWDSTLGNGGEHNTVSADPNNSIELVANTKVVLPEGFKIEHTPGSPEATVTGHGITVEHLTLSPDGSLTNESLQHLQQAGFNVAHEAGTISHDVVHQVTGESAADFVKNHADATTHVSRDFWYDNNTPSIYDKNELGLWDPQHQADGSISIHINMTEHGSQHGANAAHWQQLAREGNLKVALSMSKGTQTDVFMFNIDEKGNAIIPADHPMAGMFSEKNGEFKFNGQYTEVVQVHGTDQNGVTHIRPMATDIGRHINSFTDTITTKEIGKTNIYTISHTGTPPDVLVPPTVPIYGRRGLAPPNKAPTPVRPPEGYYGYYSGSPEVRWAKWAGERSPRIAENPNADLNTGEELRWYREEQLRRRGKEYIDEIDGYIAANKETLKKMDSDIKLTVCIPVAGASESENIYDTLSLYAQQDLDAQKATMIFLNVNWLERLEGDPDQMAKIQKTLAEIERARLDFPDLNIISFQKVWSEEFVASREGRIYGEVIKVLYDVAALSVEEAIREGRRKDTDEAILITNDADVKGMSRRYLQNYIKASSDNPETDVFTGAIRWGSDVYREYPGYGVSSVFYSVANMMYERGTERRKLGQVSTTGPNAGFRLSAYAAVGGCEDAPDMGAGADAVLGQRVASARRGDGIAPASSSSGSSSVASGGSTTYPGPTPTPQPANRTREVGRHVGGAQVDTFGDRLLGAYRRGEWIAQGWAGFDSGGYQDRSVSASAGLLSPEDPKNDIDGITTRVETNIKGFINHWYRDPAIAASALAFTFGGKTSDGTPIYDARWDKGEFKFSFTPTGKKVLQEMLLRESNGGDPYGPRIRRQLYNEGVPRARVDESLLVQKATADEVSANNARRRPTPPAQPTQPTRSPDNTTADRNINLLRVGMNTPLGNVTVSGFNVEGTVFNGPMRLTSIDPGGRYTFDPIDASGNIRSGDLNFSLDRDFLQELLADGTIRPETPAGNTPPLRTVPPIQTTAPPPPVQPPVTPTPAANNTRTPNQQQYDQNLLDGLVESNTVQSYLRINGQDYSGPMRYEGVRDGTYSFNPVDDSGRIRRDRDAIYLSEADLLRHLRSGEISVPSR